MLDREWFRVGRVGRRGGLLVLAALAAGVLAFGLAGQATANAAAKLTVCPSGCGYTTIQDAINAARDGATITVAPGTYAGFSAPGTNPSLRNVTLRGAGAAETT